MTGESAPLEEGRAVPDDEGRAVADAGQTFEDAGPTLAGPEAPTVAGPVPNFEDTGPTFADAAPTVAGAPPTVADLDARAATGARPTVADVDARAAADPICPYLGMVGDPSGHHSFPSRLHLCHAGEPAHIGLGFQADYCLGGAYPSCARYQRAEEAAAAEAAATGAMTTAMAADGSVAAAALGPVPASSGRLGRVRRPDERGRGSSRLVSVLLGLALISTLVAFAVAAGFLRLPSGGPVAVGPTPTPTRAVSPTPAPTDTLAPTASPTLTPAPTAVPTPSASAATGEVLHVVQQGETLTSISLLYNVPIAAIIARNGITDPNSIVAGQTLVIPLGGASPSPSTQPSTLPTPTTTGEPTVTPKPTKTPTPSSFVYVVQAGDTLSAIANKFNVSVQAILDANPDITDPNKIFAGQQIIIPSP